MFIVMKDGPKKGEVQEMKFAVARDLINAGRAEQYFFPDNEPQGKPKAAYGGPVEGIQSVSAPVTPPVSGKKKKK